jgi:hypothetical protein
MKCFAEQGKKKIKKNKKINKLASVIPTLKVYFDYFMILTLASVRQTLLNNLDRI